MNVLHEITDVWERPKANGTRTACAMRGAVFFHPDCEPPRRTGNSLTVGSGF
jgi:hypothetical protein